ncbi:hypothetical protein FB567DRAFT_473367 [Paraphoma chrysanthemicola]|uniref:Fumarylacetoacetase n=1 Tax=Paraphoma chrysanthemicola TaxID=798071 RepID=A0A8K0R1E7_9PLEO|nr:hypothetical protein FB567DRAFT_473367 [Paraphoma chrysanthemicola]
MGVRIDIPSDSPFTIHNIPYGVISTEEQPTPRCAVAIGSHAIDLVVYSTGGRLSEVDPDVEFQEVFNQPTLNSFAALPYTIRQHVRRKIIEDINDFSIDNDCLIPLGTVRMHLPMRIGGFSDFYCSLEHCQNSTAFMSAGTQIPKNWFYAPSVYNSRVSSIIPSPQPLRRPRGVYFKDGDIPIYGPSQQLDYELEMGFFVSKPIPFGSEVKIESAPEHIFGFVLLNDWSARDLQMFEMKPLGPFHGKGFATSISSWVVTMDALNPFRCSPKTIQNPPPFEHLRWDGKEDGAIDINLKATLKRGNKTFTLGASNLRYLYWTPFQQLTHHASAMCGMDTGDLLGTGTISGDATDDRGNKTELGCLYEATHGGTQWVHLENGTKMKYLEDEDEIILEGWCKDKNGRTVLGFGDCMGKVLPSLR